MDNSASRLDSYQSKIEHFEWQSGVTSRIAAAIKSAVEEEVRICGEDRTMLRKLFEHLWENRSHGFCCDHIATEDGNLDDACVEFCIDQAMGANNPDGKPHFDCLTMMLMLRAIADEHLRDAVVTNTPEV